MRLLVICFTLILALGVIHWAFAFDTEPIAVSVSELEMIEISLGVLLPRDMCWIWMDQLESWAWVFTGAAFDSCCEFKKYVDPYEGFTDCLPPYFPFNVESIKIGLHAYWGDSLLTYDIAFELDIEELGPFDEVLGCYTPGPEIWRSEPITVSLPGGWFGWVNIAFPCVWVNGPFFVSWRIVNHPDPVCGWMTDFDGTTPCWNWIWLGCTGYPQWYEFTSIGWTEGDYLHGVGGRPEWNVAVDMGSFEAVPGDGIVTLNWRSLSETNNDHWVVKRDGERIWTEPGQGNRETPTDYTYVDRDVVNGMTYSYILEAVNYEGNVDEYGPVTATPGPVEVVYCMSRAVPDEFALCQNYPNPFNASTVIRYHLAADEHVTLTVYNIKGQEVANLVDEDQNAGLYLVHWKAEGMSSGVYFYTLTAGEHSETKKMVFTK